MMNIQKCTINSSKVPLVNRKIIFYYRLYMDLLQTGVMVTNYRQKNIFGGDKRKVFVTDGWHVLATSAVTNSKVIQAWQIGEFGGIMWGLISANMKRFKKANPTKCFSIMHAGGTVDIEVDEDRNYLGLAKGMDFLILAHKRVKDDDFVIETLADPKISRQKFESLVNNVINQVDFD
jgi:type IV secretory pathway TrbD component